MNSLKKILCLILLIVFVLSCRKKDAETIPSLTTKDITSITQSSGVTGGSVTDVGGTPVLSRGVCWSTAPNPTIDKSITLDGAGEGSYVSTISGLNPGTKYYVKAYAINNVGTGYGEEVSFSTNPIGLPSLSTSNVTIINSSSAISGGTIISSGAGSISAKGVCWKTSSPPTLSDFKTNDGQGQESYLSSLINLLPNQNYYVRAYAINEAGIAYGNEISFKIPIPTPTVSTGDISFVKIYSARCSGNVTEDGGSTVTERGICYSTTIDPTIANFKVLSGSGAGLFLAELIGLSDNTIYYARAYAINAGGVAYGVTKSFKTVESTVTDYDGNVYQVIVIGDQFWTGSNLKTTHFGNGDPIQLTESNSLWASATGPIFSYYNNESALGDIYGALYNYYSVISSKGICPNGWHVPTYNDAEVLMNFLEGQSIAGGRLKETGTSHWLSPNTGATNESGFKALPGGFRNGDGTSTSLGARAGFYISTEKSAISCWFIRLENTSASFIFGDVPKYNNGLSIRCIRDN